MRISVPTVLTICILLVLLSRPSLSFLRPLLSLPSSYHDGPQVGSFLKVVTVTHAASHGCVVHHPHDCRTCRLRRRCCGCCFFFSLSCCSPRLSSSWPPTKNETDTETETATRSVSVTRDDADSSQYSSVAEDVLDPSTSSSSTVSPELSSTTDEPFLSLAEPSSLSSSSSNQLLVSTVPSSTSKTSTTTTSTTTTATSLSMSLPILALNLVAILWGTQHAVIKLVVQDNDAGLFTLLRFGLAAAIASLGYLLWQPPPTFKTQQHNNNDDNSSIQQQQELNEQNQQQSPTAIKTTATLTTAPWYKRELLFWDTGDDDDDGRTDVLSATAVRQQQQQETILTSTKDNETTTTLRWGAEMGFWMFLGFAFQAIGLQSTTAQKSGFLLYLNVKFVPFFARILLGREISVATWISALTAVTGTALLALTTSGAWDWNEGDAWSILAAAASAMFILRLEKASQQVPDASALNAACLWMVTILAALWTSMTMTTTTTTTGTTTAALMDELVHMASAHGWELLYLSGVTTALANWIQTKAQRYVSAERASLLYAMDPVYGAICSNLLLGETLNSWTGWMGAGLITAAAASNAFFDFLPPPRVAPALSPLSSSLKEDDDPVVGVSAAAEEEAVQGPPTNDYDKKK